MLDTVGESTKEERPSNNLKNLVTSKRSLHSSRIEDEQVAIIRESAGSGIAGQDVVQLSKGLHDGICLAHIRGPKLFAIGEGRYEEVELVMFLVEKGAFTAWLQQPSVSQIRR